MVLVRVMARVRVRARVGGRVMAITMAMARIQSSSSSLPHLLAVDFHQDVVICLVECEVEIASHLTTRQMRRGV